MEKKSKYLIHGAILGFLFYLIIQFLPSLLLCKEGGLGCLILFILPFAIPILIADFIHLPQNAIINISIIILFYTLLGAFIAWIVYIIKHGKDKKETKTETKKEVKLEIKANKKEMSKPVKTIKSKKKI
jgi:hypothetical protein